MKLKTRGISPKLIADLLVSVATFIVAYPALGLDPVLAAAIAKALGTLAAAIAGPGDVIAVDQPKDPHPPAR